MLHVLVTTKLHWIYSFIESKLHCKLKPLNIVPKLTTGAEKKFLLLQVVHWITLRINNNSTQSSLFTAIFNHIIRSVNERSKLVLNLWNFVSRSFWWRLCCHGWVQVPWWATLRVQNLYLEMSQPQLLQVQTLWVMRRYSCARTSGVVRKVQTPRWRPSPSSQTKTTCLWSQSTAWADATKGLTSESSHKTTPSSRLVLWEV